jgi:transcriptional regulator with XRE-family HTH domain
MLGARLKALRQKKGLRQKELAAAIGMTKSAVCLYEKGKRIPRDAVKIRIAETLGYSVGFIFYPKSQQNADSTESVSA